MVKDSLTKLAVKLEIETRTVFQFLPLFERVMKNETIQEKDSVLNRLYIALLKKETAEQAIHFCHEAIEMHGGNGYIEDFVTPRLLRDAQVLTVWEGTANILGLEVLRLIGKFNADQLFIREIENRLSQVSHLPNELVFPVKKGLDELRLLTASLRTASADHQTFHSKKVAKQMVKVLESITALDNAAKGNGRAKKIAEVFIEEAWDQDNKFNDKMNTVNYFSEIVLNENAAAALTGLS